ncbi:NAD(P)/FAD-dependent oxidoreductase [Elioraea sp.]|uniref:NAD(P)/FAD-dependent oxidoreductase n=1 Tax=Elioraea sp. TaxID=2185103 RepID=UPI003F6E69D8
MTLRGAEPVRRAVVLGAGIVGVLAALALQRRGFDVTMIDRDEPGRGCSYGNGGAISPDFCVPIALPGMLRRVPKWLFDREGPLVVRWRDLPASLPWLIRWIRAGRMDRVEAHARALRALHAPSYGRYRDILGPRAAGLIEMTGQLYVWRSAAAGPTEALARRLRERHGVETHALAGDEIRQMDGALATGFTRGLFFPENGHTLNPLRLVQTLARQIEEGGGRVLRGEASDIVLENGRAVGVRCSGTTLAGDIVVVAAGIASTAFARALGDRVPLQAERGYHVMLPEPGIRPRIKISNRDHMFGLTPMEHGVRIAGTVEIARPDAPMDERRPRAMLEVAKRMYPGLSDRGAAFWMGCRPSTPDSLPVIDRAARARNVIYAFGHGHTGLTGAPVTGELVAALATGERPHIDPAPFRRDRFG